LKILIRGEKVYDGTGSPPVKTDILTENDLVVDMGPNLAGSFNDGGTMIIETKGQIVCPGFIDTHRHADAAVFTSQDFGKTEILQGITTVVCGNCGISPVPANHPFRDEYYRYMEPVMGPVPQGLPLENYREYRRGLENLSLPVNFGFLAGAGAIKTAVKGFSPLPFTADEMRRAQMYVREAFDSGALGLSFGIMYRPECFSNSNELCEMAKTAASTILCVHIRGEGDSLVDSVDEVIEIAKNANVAVNISHFKSTGIKNWRGLIYRAIEKIETARNSGLEITADFYPYDGGSTTIMSLLPPAVMEDTTAALCAKLSAGEGRDLLRREINKVHPLWDNMALSTGWDRIVVSSVSLPSHNAYCGRNMQAVAEEEGFKDPADLLAELVVSEEGRAGIITFSMDQNDIDTVASLPWTCLISDSLYSKTANPHPRLNGAFPKFLREYVRERRIFTMEEAVKKMTSMPAERMGLKKRGKISPGCAADILIFDPDKFTDNAGYSNSTALAAGMGTVIINGKIVYNEGKFSGYAGKAVKR
jgi:N-acyl-D-aspartate/D-glutamate deacylase